MFKYMYTGPTALRDLRTTEQLEFVCNLKIINIFWNTI